ncbi:Hypothetical Protein FCC1311_090722 [Hondaea fermentalgiana]|uniref:Uncharacterized protein n=1 Tax=Hondaea fermentalgiana TaxID=2315210 RepID=A0A2R5GPQ2_9STRA|nr:Hypothetical Protein FCC1311_090722 [Hondaea fermentalgiana]|eukprot:GBG32847.1 Hypothetical Protein FCC1311_090722 [Hondaea fermentalgiana]
MAAKKGPPVPAKVAELLTTARRELRACLLVSEQQLAAISETRDREPALRTKLDRLLARETKWEGREKVAKHRYDELAKMEALAIERATVVEEFDTQKRLLTRQITSQLAKSSDEKVSIPEELLQMFDKIGNSHLLLAELSGVIEAGGKVLAETFEQIGTRGSELDVLTDRDIKRMVMYFSRIFPMLNQRLEDFIVRIEEEEKSVMEVTSLRSAEATKTSKDTLEALQQKWKESTLASYALPPKEDAPMSAAPSQNKQSQSQSLRREKLSRMRPLAAMPATPAKKRAVINLDLDDEEEESGSDLSDVVAIDLSASEPKSPAPGSKRPRIAKKSSISEKDAGVHPARPVTLENLPSHIFDPKFIGQAPNHPTLTGLVGSNIKIRWSADSPEVAYTVAAIKKQAVWYFLLKAANPETVPKAIRLRLDGKGKVYHVHLYDPFVSRTVTAESSYRVV